MRCAYQDVDCEKCPVKKNCGMPAFIAELQGQIIVVKEVKVEPRNVMEELPKVFLKEDIVNE